MGKSIKENKSIEEIVEKNLQLMKSCERGGMGYLLERESIGGPACGPGHSGANFYFDVETGEFHYFGNEPSVPQEIMEKYTHGCFKVARGYTEEKYTGEKIVGITWDRTPAAAARQVVLRSMGAYNSRDKSKQKSE